MTDLMEKMMALSAGKTIRQATRAEEYLMNFWLPSPGHTIFSAKQAPGDEFVIKNIVKDHTEQAVVDTGETEEVVFLQDWHWAPKPKELDEVLEAFGVRVMKDVLQRNQTFIPKPENNEQYMKVIQQVRMFGYQDGEEILDKYFERMRTNAANRDHG